MGDHVDHAYEEFYRTLHEVAERQLRGERGYTLHPTLLMNEAYLRLRRGATEYNDTIHARAVAIRAMKQVLLDYCRQRGRKKHGGEAVLVSLSAADGTAQDALGAEGVDILALTAALEALRAQDARKADVVELLFLGGLSVDEVASVLEVSRRTVERDWKVARLLLLQEMERNQG